MGDTISLRDDVVIFDINDVFEAILMFCPKRVWLALIDDHKSSELEYCIRPDLCVSKYLKIPFRKLQEISEPHDWGKQFCCSAIFRPNPSQSFHLDPSAMNWSLQIPKFDPPPCSCFLAILISFHHYHQFMSL